MKHLFRVTGFDERGEVWVDDYVDSLTPTTAVIRVGMRHDDFNFMIVEWRVRRLPTPEKFNSNFLPTGWGGEP